MRDNPAAPLKLTVLKNRWGHNHGYTRYVEGRKISGIVFCDFSVFKVTPGKIWTVEQLTDQPTSDAVLMDLKGDGQPELLTISPFHGDTVKIWQLTDRTYVSVYEYADKLPFLHAIYGGEVYGRPTVYVGNLEGLYQQQSPFPVMDTRPRFRYLEEGYLCGVQEKNDYATS